MPSLSRLEADHPACLRDNTSMRGVTPFRGQRDTAATPRASRVSPAWRRFCAGFLCVSLALLPGCNAVMNGWLDPTAVGSYKRTSKLELRTSLDLEDPAVMIPGAVLPSPGDLMVHTVEYPISPGDTLAVEINELRQRQTPFQAQVQVAPGGYVNLPVVGRLDAAGKTVPEFQDALTASLRERNVLLDPEVVVNPLFVQKATYSIFGVGVSASSDSPLRAGTFPIRRPDLQLLEAINQVGGLNEFVTEVYIFRTDEKPANGGPAKVKSAEPDVPPSAPGGSAGADPQERTVPQELLDAARGANDIEKRSEPEVPAGLEPDSSQPFIFVNGEFVANPKFAGVKPRDGSVETPPTERAVPTVNWARVSGDTTFRVLLISAEQLRQGDPSVNVVVRPGDVIRISSGEVGTYYVMGQVNRVGTFSFNLEQVTLKSAIAIAGGLSPLAWPDRCTIYRRLGAQEQMIQVNLDRIFAGLDPDFTIKRGDIINVGTHPFAPFLARIRGFTLPNPSTDVGYSFSYSRNFADIDSFSVRQNPNDKPSQIQQLFP